MAEAMLCHCQKPATDAVWLLADGVRVLALAACRDCLPKEIRMVLVDLKGEREPVVAGRQMEQRRPTLVAVEDQPDA